MAELARQYRPSVDEIEVDPIERHPLPLPSEVKKVVKIEENVQRIQEQRQNNLTITLAFTSAATVVFEVLPYALVEVVDEYEPFWLIAVSFNAVLNGVILLWRNAVVRQSVEQLGTIKLRRRRKQMT